MEKEEKKIETKNKNSNSTKTKKDNITKNSNKKNTKKKNTTKKTDNQNKKNSITSKNKSNEKQSKKEVIKDEVKKDTNKEVKKEVETKIISKEINLVPKEKKLVKNEFTSTIDIKEIIKAIPKKTHKKEEVESAIADIFDMDYKSNNKEKNEKFENLLEKTQDISIIREEIIKTETSTKEIKKNDKYLIDEINNMETNLKSINYLDDQSNLKEEINYDLNKNNIWKIISIILIMLLLSITAYLIYHFKTVEHGVVIKENKVLDENFVFLGDSITELYKLNDYYKEFKVVNSGTSGYKTTDILDKIDTMVYDYNPTKVFILIGTNDFLDKDVNPDEVYKNITKIIENITQNRKYAKIYVESIYPTCHHDDEKVNLTETNKRPNKDIKYINKQLKEYCKKNKITYIDVYSKLVDEDGELDLNYTVDGLHLSKEGYNVVTKTLMPYVKENVKY